MSLLKFLRVVAAMTLGPSAAAVFAALVYHRVYGLLPDPTLLLQLYVGFFVVGNFIVTPAFADAGRARTAAPTLAIAAIAAAAAAFGARDVFRVWPAPPLTHDALFVAAAGLAAALSFWLSAKLTG